MGSVPIVGFYLPLQVYGVQSKILSTPVRARRTTEEIEGAGGE
jgi:hypothetical protein